MNVDKLFSILEGHRALVANYRKLSERYREALAASARHMAELEVDQESPEQSAILARSEFDLEATPAAELEAARISVAGVRRLIAARRLARGLCVERADLAAKMQDSSLLAERLVDFARAHGEHISI